MTRALRPICIALCAAALLLPPASAHAQPSGPSAGAADTAKQAFERGNVLAKALKWEEAAAEYRQAWALRQAWDIAGNLGIAESEQKQWPEAAEHLAYALRHFPPSGKPDYRKVLEMRMAEARQQVGALSITVDRAGAQVMVDGKSVGTSPLLGEMFVTAGEHVVEVKLLGYTATPKTTQVSLGATQRIELSLAEATPLVPSTAAPVGPRPETGPEVPPGTRGGPSVPLLVAGTTIAAAGVAVGIGLVVAGADKFGDADTNRSTLDATSGTHACSRPELAAQCDAFDSAYKQAGTLRNAGIASIVGGVVVGGLTASYWLATRNGNSGATTGMRASARVAPNAAAVSLSGSF
ncbi:MAG: PEGA domain-containing protein [Polyangiaceae bacterium]